MSGPNLDGPRLKIQRAQEHLDAFDAEVDRFQPDPNRSYVELRVDGEWLVVAMRPLEAALPPHLSLIMGDAVNNFRSALDHLVWQLVLAAGPDDPTDSNSFPIHLKSEHFRDQVLTPRQKRNRGALHGLDPLGVPWSLIETAQPYHRVEDGRNPLAHPLSVLRILSNTDKHRFLHVQMLFPDENSLDGILRGIRRRTSWSGCSSPAPFRPKEGRISFDSASIQPRLTPTCTLKAGSQ